MSLMEKDVDSLIEECINDLCDEDISKGAESLQDLAIIFNKGGMPLQSFMNTRTYIINMAKQKTDALFIDEKLKLSEQALREKRTGSIIIQTAH